MRQRSRQERQPITAALPARHQADGRAKPRPTPTSFKPAPGQQRRVLIAFMLGRTIGSDDTQYAEEYARRRSANLRGAVVTFFVQAFSVGCGVFQFNTSTSVWAIAWLSFTGFIVVFGVVGFFGAYRARSWLRRQPGYLDPRELDEPESADWLLSPTDSNATLL